MRAPIRQTTLFFLLLSLVGCGGSEPSLRVEGAWSRPTAGATPGVVYFSIVNDGGAPDRLLGAHSTRCASVEIHQTRIVDDRMSMAPVKNGMTVAPGESVAFAPGGHHLMLFGLDGPLEVGEVYELLLEFEITGELAVGVEVRRP
jgi:copper(I)-binding protein